MTYLTIAKITKHSSSLREPVSVLAAFLKPIVGVETIGCFPLSQGHRFFFDDLLDDVMFFLHWTSPHLPRHLHHEEHSELIVIHRQRLLYGLFCGVLILLFIPQRQNKFDDLLVPALLSLQTGLVLDSSLCCFLGTSTL